MLNSLATEAPTGKFIALYSDGSGVEIFHVSGGYVQNTYGEPLFPAEDVVEYLQDAGYFHWIPLPDDYKLWYEA